MTELGDILIKIGEEFKEEIWAKSDKYCLIDIGKAFEAFGIKDGDKYEGVKAVVPLKKGQKDSIAILVNGKDLSDYAHLESGIAVPEWVAEEAGLTYKKYEPKERMTLYM